MLKLETMKEDMSSLEDLNEGFGLPRTSLAMNRPLKADLGSSEDVDDLSDEDRWDEVVSNNPDNTLLIRK